MTAAWPVRSTPLRGGGAGGGTLSEQAPHLHKVIVVSRAAQRWRHKVGAVRKWLPPRHGPNIGMAGACLGRCPYTSRAVLFGQLGLGLHNGMAGTLLLVGPINGLGWWVPMSPRIKPWAGFLSCHGVVRVVIYPEVAFA